ncbi:MAG: hypothetical protein IJT64_04765 [Kiritimatiellae bacterium]|nr:hypothetical protein [Kiritimatiellia bacterium]
MIKLIQNALTIRKGSVNFMDQNGVVIGFNPRPDGNPLSFYVYSRNGDLVDTGDTFIEQYLDGVPYHFGNDGHIIKHGVTSEEEDKLIITLVPDDGGDPLTLQIVCMNSLYYTANFVLSDKDRVAFRKPSRPTDAESARDWQLAEINHAMDELVHAREQVSKALADLDLIKQKLLAR